MGKTTKELMSSTARADARAGVRPPSPWRTLWRGQRAGLVSPIEHQVTHARVSARVLKF